MLAVFLFGLNVLHLYGTACSRHLFSNRSTLNGVNENTKSDDTENNACKVLTPYEIADIWNASFMSNWICASYVQAMCKLFLSHKIEMCVSLNHPYADILTEQECYEIHC